MALLLNHDGFGRNWTIVLLASPQTSFGVRLSRIHGGEMNAWQTNPKGRLRGGYCACKIAAGIKKYFLPKKAFSPPPSLSSQLSRLSRFLKVLENWIRQYFMTYNLRTWFILTRSKQNWPLKWKKKSLLFLPASACRRDRVWFAFIWWHFPDRRVSGKTPRADHTWQNPPRLS